MGRENFALRKVHLSAMIRIFGYFKRHMKLWIICDTRLLEDQGEVDIYINWSYLYHDAVDNIPTDMSDTKVKPVIITTFVDADNAHDIGTRSSITGLLMFQKKSIHWYSRWQNTDLACM